MIDYGLFLEDAQSRRIMKKTVSCTECVLCADKKNDSVLRTERFDSTQPVSIIIIQPNTRKSIQYVYNISVLYNASIRLILSTPCCDKIAGPPTK